MKKPKIVAIIQARMGSTRLPGKVLLPLGGAPALAQVVRRVQACRKIGQVVVATSSRPENQPIHELCQRVGVQCFAGSENDVLDRYYKVATQLRADTIVRITADCPVLDPAVTDRVISFYLDNFPKYEYVSNVHPPTYPDGLDVEVVAYDTLARVCKSATLKSDREHVTAFIWRQPEVFRIGNIENEVDLSRYRWTLDTEGDYRFLTELYDALSSDKAIFSMADIVSFVQTHPELMLLNHDTPRLAGYLKSLRGDVESGHSA